MKDRDQSAAFLGASIDPHITTIDLHLIGDVSSSIIHLEQELDRISRSGARYCRVIHGIGTGVLAEAVHNILTNNPLVFVWREEENGGSCVVLF